MSYPKMAACACAALLMSLASGVSAAPIELVNWKPAPDSISPPFAEIAYTGANLTAGPGAIGNGDGNLPIANQTPGGLLLDTVVNAPIAFSFPSSLFTGGTGYYDCSLSFTGLAPVGFAVATNLGGGLIQDSQVLGPGTFTLTSTAPSGSVILLTGNIVNAVITGINGGAAGAVFDAQGITYVGGAIVAALPANAVLAGNDMSISMTSVTPTFSIDPGTGQLAAFSADATGLFDIQVPEPASLGIFGIAMILAGHRRAGRTGRRGKQQLIKQQLI